MSALDSLNNSLGQWQALTHRDLYPLLNITFFPSPPIQSNPSPTHNGASGNGATAAERATLAREHQNLLRRGAPQVADLLGDLCSHGASQQPIGSSIWGTHIPDPSTSPAVRTTDNSNGHSSTAHAGFAISSDFSSNIFPSDIPSLGNNNSTFHPTPPISSNRNDGTSNGAAQRSSSQPNGVPASQGPSIGGLPPLPPTPSWPLFGTPTSERAESTQAQPGLPSQARGSSWAGVSSPSDPFNPFTSSPQTALNGTRNLQNSRSMAASGAQVSTNIPASNPFANPLAWPSSTINDHHHDHQQQPMNQFNSFSPPSQTRPPLPSDPVPSQAHMSHAIAASSSRVVQPFKTEGEWLAAFDARAAVLTNLDVWGGSAATVASLRALFSELHQSVAAQSHPQPASTRIQELEAQLQRQEVQHSAALKDLKSQALSKFKELMQQQQQSLPVQQQQQFAPMAQQQAQQYASTTQQLQQHAVLAQQQQQAQRVDFMSSGTASMWLSQGQTAAPVTIKAVTVTDPHASFSLL